MRFSWALAFDIFMALLFLESTYEYGSLPHTTNRLIAAGMSVIGLVVFSVMTWIQLRSPRKP